MQGGEHQVAGERGFDADRGGFLVAHFANHDDVRVGAQEGLHHHGEVEARFPVHLHLAQALLRDLDRVLGGPDLGIRGVEILQHRVQRGGLARAGRTADEEQAVGLGHRALQLVDVARAESHFFQRNRLARGEYPHHDVLDAARGRDRRDAQLDVERPEFPELDLAVLGLSLLGDVQVAHDLEAGGKRRAVARRHLDIGSERAVLPEADLGLALARVRLDVDIRGALIVGFDDDLVYQLHQLVVGRLGDLVAAAVGRLGHLLVKVRQQLVDVAAVHGRFLAIELIDRFPELLPRRDLVEQARLREYVRRDARRADAFGIQAQDHQPFPGVVDRQPLVGLDVLALQVLQQLRGLDAVGLVRLVRHAEKLGQRGADRRDLDLELVGQHLLDVDRLLARLPRGELELAGRKHGIRDQVVVLGLDELRLLALLERDGEGLGELVHAFLGQPAERHAGLVVDDLDDADQLARARLHDRRHQHLLGAVAGALVDLLQEAQIGIQRAQLAIVIDVLEVDRPLRERDVAGDRMLGDRQLQVLERVEAGLHLGDDRLPVLAHRVDREAVGVEQRADVGAHLEHDLVDVVGGVDLVGDRLELLLERQARSDVGLRGGLMAQHCAHSRPPLSRHSRPSS